MVRGIHYVQQAKLLNTSTFRLAIIYLVLFVTSVIALLGYIYWTTAGNLNRQTVLAVNTEMSDLAQRYRSGGLPMLVHTVIQRSRDPRQSLYLVMDNRGNVLAGNLLDIPQARTTQDGWRDFTYIRLNMEGQERRPGIGREQRLPGNFYLLVGRDVKEVRQIENLITSSLAWAVALTIGLGLIGGLIMSRNMLARLDDINRTSREIMGGDLARRIPVSGTGDELDQLAENLNNMLEQIEALMIGMRQVTDNIAHDLRSPLNRLRNRVEVTLMSEHSTTKDYRDALERTISEADYLLSTFNALLSIARAEAGNSRESMEWINLTDLVETAAELYEPVIEEQGARFSLAVEKDLRLFANRELLSQAILNLLDNAIKHGGLEGDIAEDIVLSAQRIDARVIIKVSDRGQGIPVEERARVMERFIRLEASRNTPGTGLGLSLVAAATRLHGGTVELTDNEPGLTVSLSLPAPRE
ncbi:MAG: signal transduction histidine kinase [Parvibaculaceae bacterium]